jgi:hypothetical protein
MQDPTDGAPLSLRAGLESTWLTGLADRTNQGTLTVNLDVVEDNLLFTAPS